MSSNRQQLSALKQQLDHVQANLADADEQKQLFAFCITRNGSSKARNIKRHRVNDDLHLADWKDQNFSYVVVGYEPLTVVKGFAEQIKESYRL